VSRPRAVARRAVTSATALVTLSAAVIVSTVLLAGPAAAENPLAPSEAADTDGGFTGGETLLFFVGLPFLAAIVLSLLFWVPGMRRVERYRPGKSWDANPVWFIGPHEPIAAVEAVTARGLSADVVRGGASGSW
jgi:hypothetical protein